VRNANKKKSAFAATLLVLIAVLLLNFSNPLKSTALFFLKPPLKLLHFISPTRALVRIEDSFLEPQLTNQINTLKQQISGLKEVEAQNERLRQLLEFQKSAKDKLVVASCIARDYSNYRHTVLIDRGISSGIQKGDCVVSPHGLIGRITQVSGSTSRVMLMTDPDFRAACLIQRSRAEGVLFGTTGKLCLMKYVPQEADVKTGDYVVTSGLGGFFKKGILAGEVAKTKEANDGLSLEVYVKPHASLLKLEEVAVILDD